MKQNSVNTESRIGGRDRINHYAFHRSEMKTFLQFERRHSTISLVTQRQQSDIRKRPSETYIVRTRRVTIPTDENTNVRSTSCGSVHRRRQHNAQRPTAGFPHSSSSSSLPLARPRPSICTPLAVLSPPPSSSVPSSSAASCFFFSLAITLSARLNIPPVGAPHAAHFGVFANRLIAHAEQK